MLFRLPQKVWASTGGATCSCVASRPARATCDDGTVDVTEFLLARLAEDEAALSEAEAPGTTGGAADRTRRRRAELRAVRAVIELHRGAADIWGFHGCLTCGNVADTTDGYPCPTVRALAAVHADHPDYRAEWR